MFRTSKSSSRPLSSLCRCRSDGFDLPLGGLDGGVVDGGHGDALDGVGDAAPEEPVLRRPEGDEDGVVLILPPGRLAFGSQDADDLHGDVPDPHRLPDGIVAAEEVLRHGVADDGHLGPRFVLAVQEEAPCGDGPLPDVEDVGGASRHGGGPVQVAVDDLGAAVDFRGHPPEVEGLAFQGVGVLHGQRRRRPGLLSHPPRRSCPGQDDEDVAPDARDVLGDVPAGSGAYGHHGDDGSHADDDPQHGEGRPDLVRQQGADGSPNGLEHGWSPFVGEAAVSEHESSPAVGRHVRFVVTRTMVFPSPFRATKRSMISMLVLESRFPVGSSARISGVPPTSPGDGLAVAGRRTSGSAGTPSGQPGRRAGLCSFSCALWTARRRRRGGAPFSRAVARESRLKP